MSTPKPAKGAQKEPPQPPTDAQGRPLVEEIDLNADEEAALDAAWEELGKERRAARVAAEKANQ